MNYGNFFSGAGMGAGLLGAWLGVFLLPLLIWSLVWKGWALWRAAKDDNKIWFVVLLVLNTVGILEILYIFVFSKSKSKAIKSIKRSK